MKAYVWSLPTRIFHWMLVLFVALAFLSADSDPLLNLHAAVGYGIVVLVVFRVSWGFIGPRYSRFSDWPLSVREAILFSKTVFQSQKEYVSHNPAASFVMLGIIVVLFLLFVTGMLAYGVQEGRGLLSFLNASFFKKMDLFVEIHEALSTLLLILVGAHMSGVLVESILHPRINTFGSIFTGYKHLRAPSVSLRMSQKFFALVMLVFALAVTLYSASSESVLTQSRYSEIDYAKRHPLFAEECASCHTLYPPALLPSHSWRLLMSDLEHHFGDDASLEPEEEKRILSYLLKHSAESSTSESSVMILKTLTNKDIIAITQTPFWKKRHDEVESTLFKSEKVKSKANCKACHTDVEKGLLEDINIKMPTEER